MERRERKAESLGEKKKDWVRRIQGVEERIYSILKKTMREDERSETI